MKKPLISIVIPTKNSEKTLGPCLASVAAQGRKDFELIIVDGNSTDGTGAVAKEYDSILITSGLSLPGSRNLGFSKARGDIFLSIDSDMILEPDLLDDIAKSIDGYGALIIPESGYGSGILSACKSLEKECYVGDPMMESARAFTRASFMKLGGYDASLLMGEDKDLHCRLEEAFPIGRTRAKVLHNTEHLSLSSSLGKSYRYGRTFKSLVSKKNPRLGKAFSGRRLFPLRHLKILIRRPLTAVLLAMLKGLEYSAFGLGYILSVAGF
ncbi:MAG: glycosyltransferase family A protein [Candidatus Micrarchaeia archaeon]